MSYKQLMRLAPLRYRAILLVISGIYLLFELHFNSLLIDVAGTERRLSMFDGVESYGRVLSAFGLALVGFGFVIHAWWLLQRKYLMVPVFVSFWVVAYVAQVIAIDHWLANSSTAKERQIATAAFWLNNALTESSLKIEGMPISGEASNTPEEKAFLTILGALISNDEQLLESLDSKKNDIIEQYVRRSTMSSFDEVYSGYKTVRSQVRTDFREYDEFVAPYYEQMSKVSQSGDKEWGELQDMVAGLYEIYQRQVDEYEQQLIRLVNNGYKSMEDHILFHHNKNHRNTERRRCNTQRCAERRQRYWDRPFKRAGFSGAPDPDAWTEVVRGKTKYGTTSQYVLKKLKQWDKSVSRFKSQANRYPPDITNWEDFRNHPRTSVIARYRLKKKGVMLPKSWTVNDKRGFVTALVETRKNEVDAQFISTATRQGFDLPKNLTWTEFQKLDETQSAYQQVLGPFYSKTVMSTWNDRQFKQRIVEPYIKSRVDQIADYVNASEADFADGGRFEREGKDFYLAVMVPAIAMILSLGLALFTMVKLLVVGTTMLFEVKYPIKWKKDRSRYTIINWSAISLLLVSVYVVGSQIDKNAITDQNSKAQYFITTLETNGSSNGTRIVEWFLNVQPRMYPFGATVESKFHLYRLEKKTQTFEHGKALRQEEGNSRGRMVRRQA